MAAKDSGIDIVTGQNQTRRTAMQNRDQIIRELARKHLGIAQLDERKNDSLDFHTVPVWSVRTAMEAAYTAGQTGAVDDDSPAQGSGTWIRMTVDDAVEHLKTWIDGIEDPSELATLMLHVCGCPRAAVIDGTHIAAELP